MHRRNKTELRSEGGSYIETMIYWYYKIYVYIYWIDIYIYVYMYVYVCYLVSKEI